MSTLKRLETKDIIDTVSKYLEKEGEPGLKTGFKCLDELYSHKNGGVTDWTGFPASGKTYFCLELLMNLSIKEGKRHALYVPDIGSDKEVIAKLLKMVTGKDFTDKYHNKMTQKELSDNLDWVMSHFVILKRTDFKKGVSPIEFWETVCNYKDDVGIVNTGLIDSWKNMKHIYSGREDLYLDDVLSLRNELAEENQKHFHTIAHAVKTEADVQGKRRIPSAWDIKGGGSWYANGKSIITVDFPIKTEFRVDLYISKVKPEDVGKVGEIKNTLFLDRKKGRYFEKIAPLDTNFYAYDHCKEPENIPF